MRLKTDPYGTYFEAPPNNASVVCDTTKFSWHDDVWMQRRRAAAGQADRPVSIYEVHLGSWRRKPEDANRPLSYRELAPVLADYVTEMGFKQPTPTIEGPLYKFCKNPDAAHCPGDKRYQMALGSGYSWDSYSGATFLNGETRANANNLTKRTAVSHPSDRFIWIEGADMRGENIGSWNLSAYGTAAANFTDAAFGDSPAAFHITSAVFNFCDGHAESHKWHDGATISFANDPSVTGKDNGSDGMRGLANHPNNSDLQWVGSHYPGNQNP